MPSRAVQQLGDLVNGQQRSLRSINGRNAFSAHGISRRGFGEFQLLATKTLFHGVPTELISGICRTDLFGRVVLNCLEKLRADWSCLECQNNSRPLDRLFFGRAVPASSLAFAVNDLSHFAF
jgi:hypothetical protein